MKKIALLVLVTLALLYNNHASVNMPEEAPSVLMSEALQATTMSEEDPFATIGEDFLVVGKESYAPVLYILFDNTHIYIDIEDDGVWEEHIVRNAGSSYTVSIPTRTILYGTRIHTDKPVIYWQQLSSSAYDVIPPIGTLRTSYYVYGGTWYVVVPENTTINVDNNDDGIIDSSINATPLTRNSISASNFARVFADKPFYLYCSYTLATQSGTDFYLPWNKIYRLIVTENNTLLKVDIDNDGHYDEEHTLNKGVVTNFAGFTFNHGAHIWTDKPVAIFSGRYWGGWGHYYWTPYRVLPSNMIGNDMWSPGSGSYYYITGFFKEDTGLYSNTTYYIDKVTDNDLVPDATDVVNANQYKSLPSLGMIHIWGNMPFYESYRCGSNIYGTIPYSSITATTHGTQKVLGANESTEIYVRVFNPFATTTANNLSITVPIPKNFSLHDGSSLTLNIEKRFLRNDTVIANDTIVVSPTNTGENFVFTITKTNTSLLSSLEPMTYYDIRYQVITPPEYGSYRFEPVSLSFDAETWNMPQ